MNKPMFEFYLRPLHKVEPWGQKPNQSLHWFGLTDGLYQINLGDEALYLPSESIETYSTDSPLGVDASRYVDYQVVRLLEDFLSILPDVLTPIPHEVFDLISDLEKDKKLHHAYFHCEQLFEDETFDKAVLATSWYSRRSLDSGHLRESPKLNVFRLDDQILMRWDRGSTRDHKETLWKPDCGEFRVTVGHFTREIIKFHRSLVDQMQLRIEELESNNLIPQIKIDIEELKNEHRLRELSLELALNTTPQYLEWAGVLDANRDLFPEFFHP